MNHKQQDEEKYNRAVWIIIVCIFVFILVLGVLFAFNYNAQTQQPDFLPPTSMELEK